MAIIIDLHHTLLDSFPRWRCWFPIHKLHPVAALNHLHNQKSIESSSIHIIVGPDLRETVAQREFRVIYGRWFASHTAETLFYSFKCKCMLIFICRNMLPTRRRNNTCKVPTAGAPNGGRRDYVFGHNERAPQRNNPSLPQKCPNQHKKYPSCHKTT